MDSITKAKLVAALMEQIETLSDTKQLEYSIPHVMDILKTMPDDTVIMLDKNLRGDKGITIEPVTVSCDDDTVICYVLTDKSTAH